MKHKQSGMTLIGFVIALAVAGVFVYVGMKLIPMYTEFYSLKQALSAMANEDGIANKSAADVRRSLEKRLNLSYVGGIKRDNVKIERKGASWMVTVDYENRRDMIANLDVVGKFHAEKELARTTAGGQ